MATAEYTSYKKPKPGGGFRVICVPKPALMRKQRNILAMLKKLRLPSGPILHGYMKRRSIVSNARGLQVFDPTTQTYRTPRYLLKADIKDFFDSCEKERVVRACKDMGIPDALIKEIEEFCFRRSIKTKKIALPQGAPTSPFLSNIFMMEISRRLGGLVRSRNTRSPYVTKVAIYCDNISFTSDDPRLVTIVHSLRKILEDYGLKLNEDKVEFHRQPARFQICGVVINSKISPKREYWRTLRAQIHNALFDLRSGIAPPGLILEDSVRRKIRELANLEGREGLRKKRYMPAEAKEVIKDAKFEEIPWSEWDGQISFIHSLDREKATRLRASLAELREETEKWKQKSSSQTASSV